ncbi:peptidyl-tRNA hydrolase [bacterium BMS3Bbin04]|nr:peptidyl-tRNA hydrolase [bacterium BMS3Bbin04]
MEARLIVGLGNPGPEYEATWHNLGFRAVRQVAKLLKTGFHQADEALVGQASYARLDVRLLLPQTFMNRSGQPVRRLVRKLDLQPQEILIVYDDHDLPRGQLRMRERGGDGGHRGLRSVLFELASDNVARLRVGIRDENHDPEVGGYEDLADRVLDPLTVDELAHLDGMAVAAADAARDWLVLGAKRAMNIHNRKRVPFPGEGE